MDRKSNKYLVLIAVMTLVCLTAGIASAAPVTQSITYQGKLTNAADTPLTGTYTVIFKLYDASTGGTTVSTDTHSVTATNGLFTTSIAVTDPKLVDGRALWLGIKVGSDPEMTPRQEIRPVPYALSLRPGAVVQDGSFTSSAAGTSWSTRKPGINVSTQYDFNPAISFNTSGSLSSGIFGNTRGFESYGAALFTEGMNSHGLVINTKGSGSMGVYAYTNGSSSPGMYAYTNGSSSPGIFVATLGQNSQGISVGTWGDTAYAVDAETHGPNSIGVDAQTLGQNSAGIRSNTNGKNSQGVHTTTNGDTAYAVDAETHGSNSIAVDAWTTGSNSAGIRSNTEGPNSRGLYVLTEGETSPGVVAHTYKDYSEGVYSVTDGGYSHGVYVKAQGSSSQGVNASSAQATAVWADTGRADHMYGVQTPDYMRAARYDTGSSDVAEYMPVTGDVTPGTVLIIGDDRLLMPSATSYDTRVAGIVSTAPGVSLGTKEGGNEGEALIAVSGRVPCKVDATNGPIVAGDLLTTSNRPGYAMKAEPTMINGRGFYPDGTVLGKAFESLGSGTGTIDVLVTLQ